LTYAQRPEKLFEKYLAGMDGRRFFSCHFSIFNDSRRSQRHGRQRLPNESRCAIGC
jgi:hypothetical protein